MNSTLKKIDTSYWNLNSIKWVNERKRKWEQIGFFLRYLKPLKKNINPIKEYYLKGKMPNWKAYKDWDNSDRHLDLLMFLWLHPCWDETILIKLRNQYIESDLVTMKDVQYGFWVFLSSQEHGAARSYKKWQWDKLDRPYLEGKTEMLFDILMGEDWYKVYKYRNEWVSPIESKKYEMFSIPRGCLSSICFMTKWMELDEMYPINNDFLFQYERPLLWWYDTVKDVDYFNLIKSNRKFIPSYYKCLYRLRHLSEKKELSLNQSNLNNTLLDMLDGGEFFKEFNEMWKDIKSDKVKVENPWED